MQDKKIIAITKKGSDIIFLSDIRMNSEKNSYAIHDLEKKLFQRGYKMVYNSKKSSRGVGILFKISLDLPVTATHTDPADNVIVIETEIKNVKIMLGAIYGPNKNEIEFFENLSSILDKKKTVLKF
jgi:hypothetical protein